MEERLQSDWVLLAGQSALVTGGARSGKSRFAERLAGCFQEVVYLATAEALDQEMLRRIETHQRYRPTHWTTVEEPLSIVPRLTEAASACDLVLLDCITLWISNLLGQERSDRQIEAEIEELAQWVERQPARLVLVTNEVGAGIVPANALSRRFRDLTGLANQRLAAACDHVYWLVAGIPNRIKAP